MLLVVIAVDDDAATLRMLVNCAARRFTVVTTATPQQALQRIDSDPSVAIVIVQEVLRQGSGLELLERVRQVRPTIRRFLLTQFSDLSGIVKGLHSGAIQRTICKPLDSVELSAVLAIDLPAAPARAVG